MKKRIASLLMAIVMLASLGVGSLAATTEKTLVQGNNTGLSAANFKDLADATKPDGRHWAWDAIDHVVKFGLFNGTSPTTFAPQNSMTRAQFVVVVTRLENTSRSANNKLNVERVPTKTRFTDVPEDMWCAGSVAWAEANGIVEGYSDNTFKPNQAISRAQIAAFVYRYVNNYKKYNLKLVTPAPAQFTDFNTANQVFHSAIDYCRTHGLIQGYGDHSLKPNIAVTRAQVAAILSRIIIVLSSGRSGGGGSGPAPMFSVFSKDTGFANWASAAYGVKFVATLGGAPDGAATPNTYATATLKSNPNNAYEIPATLNSGEGAIAAVNNAGFTLTVSPMNGYAISSVKAYYDPATQTTTNANTITGAGAELLTLTDYTWANPAASMTKAQFDLKPKVTVVVEFVETKLQPTEITFIALDENGTVNTAVGSASVKMYTNSDNAETTALASGGSVTQKQIDAVWQSMEMTAVPAAGYEVASEDDFSVYNTSTAEWNAGGAKLTASDYDLSGNTVIMDEAQLGTYLALTVVVKFSKYDTEYKMETVVGPVSGVRLSLDTTKSFKDAHWLPGGTPIKDAARLLIDDGPNSTDNPLGSDEADTGNVFQLEGTIEAAMNTFVYSMLTEHHDADSTTGAAAYDGFKKDVTDMGRVRSIVGNMVSTKGVDALTTQLTSGSLDSQILSEIDTSAIISTIQSAMFNAIDPSVLDAPAGATLDTRGFVRANGTTRVVASDWGTIGTSDFAITMDDNNKLLGSDLSFADVDQIAIILHSRSDYIKVSAEVTGLDVMLNSLHGNYSMTFRVPDLYVVPVVDGVSSAPVAVNSYLENAADGGVSAVFSSDKKTLTLTGSLADVDLGDPVRIDNVALPADMELPMKDLLFEDGGYVKELFEKQKDQLRTAVENTGASEAVMASLDENILSLVEVSKFVDEARTTNEQLYLKQGILRGCGEKWRTEVIRDFYDGFWKVHAKLFTEYPGDSQANVAKREAVLNAILDWFSAKLRVGTGKADELVTVLAHEPRPTIKSLYTTTFHGTAPTGNSVASSSRPANGMVTVPRVAKSMASSSGLTTPNQIPTAFTISARKVAES